MSVEGDSLGLAIRDAIDAIPLGSTYDAAKRDSIMKGIGNAIWNSAGGYSLSRQATAVSVLASTSASIVGVTDTAAKRTIILPSSQVAIPGRVYWVSDESAGAPGSNVIDVVGQGGELVDGVATFAMYGGEIVGFYATGSAWRAGI